MLMENKNERRERKIEKEESMFWMLRTLVRQGKLEPAFARQIYEKHLLLSGKKEIPFGHAIWFGHGWMYDKTVWGSKEATQEYYDSYKGSPYCPVKRLPERVGYDRRKLKARVFELPLSSRQSRQSILLKFMHFWMRGIYTLKNKAGK